VSKLQHKVECLKPDEDDECDRHLARASAPFKAAEPTKPTKPNQTGNYQ